MLGVANGGQVVAAFVNGGRLYTVTRRGPADAWPAPVSIAGAAAAPSIDLSVNGAGYLVWSSAGDVRAATLARTETTWSPLDAPLDVSPAANAGSGAGAPRVTAAADGTALAAWGESGHVYARRLFGTRQSTDPQQLDVATLAGHAGGVADTPRVDIADDSSFAWVAFRQAFDGGASTQVLARRLVGSAFDPPEIVGGGFGAESTAGPALDVAGLGWVALASDSTGSHVPWGAQVYADIFHPATALDSGSGQPSQPQVAVGENDQASVGWLQGPASGPVAVHARGFKEAKATDAEKVLSDPAAGSVDPAGGFFAAADRYGDTVFAFVEVGPGGRRLMAARWDRPPGYILPATTSHWRRPAAVTWSATPDPWGPLTFAVVVDGRTIGSTTAQRLAVAGRVGDGVHRWRVVATDPRGQRSSSTTRTLRLDGTPPRVSVAISGRRAAGSPVRFVSRARDGASGVARVSIGYGDGSPVVFGSDVRHVFRSGRYTVTIAATDAAGNRTVMRRAITVS